MTPGFSDPLALGLATDWTRILFEVMDDIVLVHDLDGHILEANAAASRRLGYPREVLLTLCIQDIEEISFAAATGWSERIRMMTEQPTYRFEGRQRTRDGSIIFVDVSTCGVRLHGKPAILAVARDITRRIAMEKALSDSEALYHSLVESLPQNIFRKDLLGRFTFGNQRYCSALGLTPAQLLGKTDFDLFPRELAAKYVLDDQEVIRHGKVFETVEDHRLPDGTQIFVQVVKTPVHDAAGKIIGTQAIFWDVTEQRLAALAVAESERRYRQLAEATLDGIIVADRDERITLFNPAAERMFGYQAAEVLGRTVSLLMPPRDDEAQREGFRVLAASTPSQLGNGRTVEVSARRKDGSEFPVEVALTLLSREPMLFLGALRDLTERKKIHAILMQNEKLASIGMLSAGVAHEINNPLAFVSNNIAVLERDCQALLAIVAEFEKVRERLSYSYPDDFAPIRKLADSADLTYIRGNLNGVLQRTRDGVDRVTRIVHSLRGLARTDPPKRQECHVPDLVASSLEILRNRLKKGAIEVVEEHDAVPRVGCVATQISQVILNLLLNAVQAVEVHRKEGGRITVRTRRHPAEMLIEIADNGPGIALDHLAHVFDPFFTTKDVGEGTGLGLSISHNIVTAHGGRIEVESKPPQGASFRIYLPLRSRTEPRPDGSERRRF